MLRQIAGTLSQLAVAARQGGSCSPAIIAAISHVEAAWRTSEAFVSLSSNSLTASQLRQQHKVRSIHSSSARSHGSGSGSDSSETISVTFVDKEGKEHTVQAPLGKNLLEVAHENEIDLEGACEGSLACSTCHVIVENDEYFKRIPEPSEDELDMLDLAFGLSETSRLGCQVIAAKELDGLRVRIPSASRNFYVDGHKPKPH